MKEYVAGHPSAIGLPANLTGETEYVLQSGDAVDVLFRAPREWIAVEVKSRISPEADIVSGILQCVKYRAVIEALQVSLNMPPSARAILVLGTALPPALVRLKNELGMDVVEEVEPR